MHKIVSSWRLWLALGVGIVLAGTCQRVETSIVEFTAPDEPLAQTVISPFSGIGGADLFGSAAPMLDPLPRISLCLFRRFC